MIQRKKGVVVSYKSSSGGMVRVRDTDDPYNGLEFPILSTHNDITLAPGIAVDFIIATDETDNEKSTNKAIDVRPIDLLESNAKKNMQDIPPPYTVIEKGYRVTVQYIPVSEVVRKIKRAAIAKVVANSILRGRRLKKEEEKP